jgi:hypothetical protein
MGTLMRTIIFILMGSNLVLSCGCDSGSSLKLCILFDKTKLLQAGASVNYAHNNQTIGRVTNISIRKDGKIAVDMIIFSQFKGLVRSGVMFVVDSPFLTDRQTRIIMDILPKDSDNPEIKSGAVLNGVTWVFYKIAIAADTISPAADVVIAHSKRLLDELELFIKSEDFDRLLAAFKKQAAIISGYTMEQKRNFEKNILLELEKKVRKHYEKLESIYNQDEMKKNRKGIEYFKTGPGYTYWKLT